jgi:imidazole glycerol-phosphate synthase subunit HisH
MTHEVVVVDYGCGNIQSLDRALKRIGVQTVYTSNIEIISKAQKIILPGVGSYATGMSRLQSMGLIEVIKDFSKSGKPLLGICLGMQLLLDYSEEFGHHKGLGVIHGSVTKFMPSDGSKVPHTGWNSIKLPEDSNEHFWSDQILNEISPGTDYYFVHSFMVKVNQAFNSVAETTYGGVRFSSIIRHKNVYGCQFHPEKSGITGSKFLENFIKI